VPRTRATKTAGVGETALFISDVHSNIEALRSVLARVGDVPIFCLGDIVGYGASPNEVVDLLRERRATCVIGNHDNAAVTGDVRRFNPRAAVAAAWTSRKLTDENRLYLAALPRERTVEMGKMKVYMTHGSPDDHLWEYVSDDTHSDVFDRYFQMLEVDVIALGHTHVPFVWSERGKTVFNPGSVGQPRVGDSRASYALLTVDGTVASVEDRVVEYDVASAARKILEAELPGQLAERLFAGE
jgi:putative phosphoesterase